MQMYAAMSSCLAPAGATSSWAQASFSYIRKADPKDSVKFQKTVQKVLKRQDNMVELMTLVTWQVAEKSSKGYNSRLAATQGQVMAE